MQTQRKAFDQRAEMSPSLLWKILQPSAEHTDVTTNFLLYKYGLGKFTHTVKNIAYIEIPFQSFLYPSPS